MEQHELIEEFGHAVTRGNGALFVGAGLSMASGMAGWEKLLEEPRTTLDIPEHRDLPLVAEYIVQDPRMGRTALEHHLFTAISGSTAGPTQGHQSIARLPISEIWTTNYDRLLEQVCLDSAVAVADDDVRLVGSSKRTIVKMHGSISANAADSWASKPVITRSDYETYERDHPRTWALLRASYLSRTFLFLGFSFTDPNVEVLLRLARMDGTAIGDRHMAILRVPGPDKEEELKLHHLRVRDFEDSGVRVCEIEDYDELGPLLEALVRRTRPERLFISGSIPAEQEDADLRPWCDAMASQLAGLSAWELTSLGGPAGWHTTRAVARIRRAENTYDPTLLTFYFRIKNDRAPELEERVGNAVYTALEREELVGTLLDDCRAMLVIGGGDRTTQEIQWAKARGIGVVPLGASGGTAGKFWKDTSEQDRLPLLGGQSVDPQTWKRLGDPSTAISSRAVSELLKQAMYYR